MDRFSKALVAAKWPGLHKTEARTDLGSARSRYRLTSFATFHKSEARIWPRMQLNMFKTLQVVPVPLESRVPTVLFAAGGGNEKPSGARK